MATGESSPLLLGCAMCSPFNMSDIKTSTTSADAAAAALRLGATNFFSDSLLTAADFTEMPEVEGAYDAFVIRWREARSSTSQAIRLIATNIDDLHDEFIYLDADAAAGAASAGPFPPGSGPGSSSLGPSGSNPPPAGGPGGGTSTTLPPGPLPPP